VGIAGAAIAFQALAAPGASLIDASERGLAADIGWLVDRGVLDLPVGTWPLPLAALQDALAKPRPVDVSEADVGALERVERALQRLGQPASAGLAVNSARHLQLSGESGPRARSTASVTAQRTEGSVALRVRLNHEDRPIGERPDSLSLQGSYAAVPLGNAILSFGQLDRWWGPGTLTNPVLSNSAPPVPAVLLRRAVDKAPSISWLEWIGPWGYELSAGRLLQYTPRGANLLGMRLYSRPWRGVELGVSRAVLWGGEGRPKSLSSLGRALIGRSNPSSPGEFDDPSAEIAGFDARLAVPLQAGHVIAGYAHIVGEDEAHNLPYKLFGTVGLQFRQALGSQRIDWTLEGTDTMTRGRLLRSGIRNEGPAYTHGVYVEGHHHLGLPIGAHFGGGGHRVTLGMAWTLPADWPVDRFALTAGRVRLVESDDDDTPALPARRTDDLTLRLESQAGPGRWHLGVSLQDGALPGRRDFGVIGGIEWPLGSPR
jgi:hypothetical protein